MVRSTALRALELDPELGEAHKGLSIYLAWHDCDWDNALAEARLGIQKSPQSVWSHFYHAGILATMRRDDEMVTAFLPALELDPLNPIIAAHYSLFLFYAGRNDEAETQARNAMKLFPDYWFNYYMLSYVSWKRRDADSAITNMERANELTGGDVPWLNCALAAMSFTFGRTEDAERWLATVEKLSESTYVTTFGRAVIEIARGNTDEAIAWLERAHAEHDTLFAWTRAFCEQQDIIGDQRIRQAMERLGLP
jgi:tetratricopeptide (TPR) repeat protein